MGYMCLSVCVRDHYFFVTCGLSIISVILGVSDVHQSNFYLSYGLFQIIKLTNRVVLLKLMKDVYEYHGKKIWTVPHPNHKLGKAASLRNMICCVLLKLFHRNVR